MANKNIRTQVQLVETAIHIDALPEVIWLYMADLPFLRMLPFTTTTMEVDGEPVNVGTMYRWAFAFPFGATLRFDEVVTEWIENERIAYRALTGWEMQAELTLTPKRGGTRLVFSLSYRLPGLWKLTPRWLMELGCRQGLKSLKKMIEAKPKKEGMENAHSAELH